MHWKCYPSGKQPRPAKFQRTGAEAEFAKNRLGWTGPDSRIGPSNTDGKEIMSLAHEIADAIVNENGYADDAEESELRSIERDRLEAIIKKTIDSEQK